MSVVAVGSHEVTAGAGCSSSDMLRSKMGISKSSSLDGSGAVGNIGCSSNSFSVSACTEAIVRGHRVCLHGCREQKSVLEVDGAEQRRIRVETAVGICGVVRLINVNLFDGSFHVKIFIKDDGA
uniref:Uncharacterized protein n=1 Tax=Romanomermis culicivorax TaxID=13658 RepID=A0A915L7C5_ROMCU